MRILKRLALVFLALIFLPILLAALGTFIPFPFLPDPADDAPLTRRILIVSNPIHTDTAIPIEPESLAALPFLADAGLPVRHPEAKWLLVGWGGRSFYMETPTFADIKPGPTFRALTIDSSVMHVDVVGDIPLSLPVVTAVDISDAAYANLLAAMSGTFTRKDGQVLPITGYALGENDRFFEGEGFFNALLGCNLWTARMLHAAGLRTGFWTPLPVLLTTSLGMFNTLPARGKARVCRLA